MTTDADKIIEQIASKIHDAVVQVHENQLAGLMKLLPNERLGVHVESFATEMKADLLQVGKDGLVVYSMLVEAARRLKEGVGNG